VAPDGVATLYLYNGRGELETTVLDVNRNGQVDWAGPDRITQTLQDVTVNPNAANVRRTRTLVWADGSSSGLGLSTNEVSTDGLQSWTRTAGGVAHSQAVYGNNGLRTVTVTRPDSSRGISLHQNGLLQSVTQQDAAQQQIGQTSFGYDLFNRRTITTERIVGLGRLLRRRIVAPGLRQGR